ncbi:MAG TPA: hypothetical protein VN673_15740, partial [Clostridia bacterium]|nr:hypothetical protein [Clostridia bacterium]
RIDAGGAPAARFATSPQNVNPEYTPTETLQGSDDLSLSLVRDGRLDTDALAAMDRAGDPRNAAAAYFIAARYEQERGNREKSLGCLQRALTFLPENSTLLDHYAALLVQMGRASEAVPHAERAVRISPNSADSLTVLGYAYFGADRTRDAIRIWKRSLLVRPDATVQSYLKKAEREAAVEAEFSQNDSGHFTLKYEGKTVSAELGQAILQTLESHYDDMVRELGVTPRANIGVVLYTEQAFFDVTQSPGWISALNDGRIRIPIEGVSSMTRELSRVLRHELAHSFITQVSRGRCPQWLHEGIAQLLEPRSVGRYGRQLASLYASKQQVPLNLLEGSFMRLSGEQASLAYTESLLAAEYINDTYGMGDLRLILERIGQGSSTESALRTTVHSGYDGLELEMARYLKDKYSE